MSRPRAYRRGTRKRPRIRGSGVVQNVRGKGHHPTHAMPAYRVGGADVTYDTRGWLMSDRPPPFNPLIHRLHPRAVYDDVIDLAVWNRTRAEGGFVGTCRECGGHVKPAPTTEYDSHAHVQWFEAVCILCRKTIVSPNGRTLRRSSAHNEMPGGWWDNRERSLRGEP